MSDDPHRGLLSASKMEGAANCPGKLALENKVRESGRVFELPDPARTSGLKIHDYLALDILGGTAQAADFFSTMNADERATAKMCVELRDIALIQWGMNAYDHRLIETRLWYRRGLFERVFSGQPDLIQINYKTRRAIILNYKTGRVESHEAADNLQLRAEVVLLKHNYPEINEISAAIIEPWVSWESVQVRYTGDDLRQAENQILAICDRARWEADKRVAGPWCRYCAARIYCAESLSYVQSIPKFNAEIAIKELPRGEAGTVLWEKLKVAKKLIESLEEAYIRILEDIPDALPGYILPAQGKERRMVPYPAKLKAALSDYLSAEEIDGCATYWVSKIEEILGLKHKIEGKELKTLFAKLTKDVVEVLHDRPFIRALTKREREAP